MVSDLHLVSYYKILCCINIDITYQHCFKNLEHDFKGGNSLVKGSFAETNYSFLRLSENVSCLCASLNGRMNIGNGFIIPSWTCGGWRGNKKNHKTSLDQCSTHSTHTVYGS